MTTSTTKRTASTLLVAAALLAAAGCRHDSDTAAELGAQEFTIELATPPDVPITTVALGAKGSLAVGRGAQVRALGSLVPVATNMGANGVAAQPDSTAGDIWSASRVELKDRARVMGSVHALEIVSAADVSMAGPVDRAPKLAPARVVSWKISYGEMAGAAVAVSLGSSRALVPGQYGSVDVPAGGTLTLQSGSYQLDSLSLDPAARIQLNQGDGPVSIYVRGALRFDGVVASTSGRKPDLMLVYLGASDLAIESPFTGTLIATQAKVTVRSPSPGFSGALFAPDVEIADGVTVTFAPPNAVLKAAGVPLGDCLAMMLPAGDAQGRQGEIQYQEEILRTCTGAGLAACETTLVARANADFFAAAQAALHGTVSPAAYVALARDRERKLRAVRGNEQVACAVVADDPDGDFVPTGSDACPATPDLTPTLDNGCTDTSLPRGPSTVDFQKALGSVGITADPRCLGASTPTPPAPLGAWRYPSDPSVGKAVWVSRQSNPSGCPIYYQLEADLTDGHTSHISIKPTEDTTLAWIDRPANAVQINIKPNDGGDRAAWASYSVYTVRYRARAISGSGRRSEWSEWFSPGHEDCAAGIRCAD
jgi:hypothetical protein